MDNEPWYSCKWIAVVCEYFKRLWTTALKYFRVITTVQSEAVRGSRLRMDRRDPAGERSDLVQQSFRLLAEIDGVAEDFDAGAADDVADELLVALGVGQVAAVQAGNGAVGEWLVRAGVGVTG